MKIVKVFFACFLATLLIPVSALAATSTLWEGNITDKNKGTYTPLVSSSGNSIQACFSNNSSGNTIKITPYEIDDSKKTAMAPVVSFTTSNGCITKSLSGWKDGKNKKAEVRFKIVSTKGKTVYVRVKHTY
ncbi:hypothetical protein HNP21_005781 [Bacillus aryabhattai]|uniref:Uncharacterized protein n=1 Tax=Priestia aryabhattai TaxID=412384 RepID=A0A7W3NGM3_PRIAR|nr:hypothetical protein [Priestia aryabhattai]MBA9042644.1 hypothetical protein [Priestia aryabhattai]